MTNRTRTFLGIFLASAAALAVSALLVERSLRAFLYDDIRRTLLGQAHLTAALVPDHTFAGDADAEADELGRRIGARVTLIASDGRVVGDSEVPTAGLAAVENHATRGEILEAERTGTGTSVRRSSTTGVDTMYAAVRIPEGPWRYVRMALPLTVIEDRVADVRRLTLVGLAVGLLAATVVTAVTSVLLNRRIRGVAETAQRYRAGDFSRPAHDYGRDEIGIVANVLDSTARELGLRLADSARARARTDAILSGMVEGVLLVDRGGHVVLVNPALRAMFGWSGGTDGQHYLEVVRQPAIASMIAAALAGDPTAPVEVEIDRDLRRQAVANVVPVRGDEGGGAVLVLHDITDLRHADQVRRDFVANVSHELRTPLTAIRGYVEALADGPASPADSRKFIEIIARHAERMERLVHDLLRLARLDSGQETAQRSVVAIAPLVSLVVQDLQPLLTRRRIDVSVETGPDAAHVLADSDKLQDALRNLLENAANYAPEGSRVDVISERCDRWVDLHVADRGPGVPEADLPRIFERFYRVDRSRSRDPGGTGLGLSIVKHLVEVQGGTVRAGHRAGGGALFTMRLPGESRPSVA